MTENKFIRIGQGILFAISCVNALVNPGTPAFISACTFYIVLNIWWAKE